MRRSDTVARYLPLFHERGDHPSVVGTLAVSLGLVIGLGTLLGLCLILAITTTGTSLIAESLDRQLVLILAVIIPIEVFIELLTSVCAAFGAAHTIVVHSSLLTPGLRLILVLLLYTLGGSVTHFAIGYVIASLCSALAGMALVIRLVRSQVNVSSIRLESLHYPWRQLLTFAIPTAASAAIWLLLESLDTILLGHFRGGAEVADYRVIIPIAKLGSIVMFSFGRLYTSAATRAYAKGDVDELADLYWRTATWVTVLTFPFLALSIGLARPIVELAYGSRYADSASLLSLLAFGYFVNGSLGFNGATLRVHRVLRFAVLTDVAVVMLNLCLSIVLIPKLGAHGAALSIMVTLVVLNLTRQIGIWRFTNIPPMPGRFAASYAGVLLCCLSLIMLTAIVHVHTIIALAAVIADVLIVGSIGFKALGAIELLRELRRYVRLR